MFGSLKDKGKAWATSPQAMKLLMNPKVQKAMMKAMQMPGTVRQEVTSRTHQFANYADLVTRKDVQVLTKHLRKLEREVARLNQELEKAHAQAAAATSTPAPAAAPAVSESKTAASSPKPKKVVKKKVKRKVVKKAKSDS
jgi:glutamate-1-semialdehyde aminotransferase